MLIYKNCEAMMKDIKVINKWKDNILVHRRLDNIKISIFPN